MEFKENASIYGSDGKKVGELDRIVIDPKAGEVTHLIARKGLFLPTDKVIPVDWVSRTSDEEVFLNEPSDRMDDLPEYEEINYLPVDDEDSARYGYRPGYSKSVYWYPVVGSPNMMWSGGYWGPMPPSTYDPGFRLVEEKNIPEDTIALKRGAKVIAEDGETIGEVEKLVTESQKEQITHLVITKGLLNQEKKLIPASWVSDVKEDGVLLSVKSKIVDRLRDYEE